MRDMRFRPEFMGNGHAGRVLDLILKGRSRITYLNLIDYNSLRFMLGSIDGISIDGNIATVRDAIGNFETTLIIDQKLRSFDLKFADKYPTVSYLLYDDLGSPGYLLTELGERLVV